MSEHVLGAGRLLLRLLALDTVISLGYSWLRYLDNRRKNKPLSDPWQRRWMKFIYDSQYGYSTLTGDKNGVFSLTWHGPMPWMVDNDL